MLKIDPEFKSLLQPLSPEEFEQLKQNLFADGCREPLVVWGDIIVDGHNRYEICTKHGVVYKTMKKEFKDRKEVMDWIDKNQLGRRNLTHSQMELVLYRLHERRKQKHGEKSRFQQTTPSGNNCHMEPKGRTRDIIGKELGVSPKTVQHAVDFGKAIDALGQKGEEIKEKIKKGERVIRKHVIAAAKALQEGDDKIAEKILKEGTKVPFIPEIAPHEVDEKIKFIFEQAKLFDKWERDILDVKKEILQHAGKNPAMAFVYRPFITQKVKALLEVVRGAKPQAICTACNGTGDLCKHCKGTGFLPKSKGK